MSLQRIPMRRRIGAFTMIELVMVIVIVGIVGAIGVGRFFDNRVFESRAYADQAKALIRYAQKLAISQNRPVFVRGNAGGFAICFDATCGAANNLASAPGGNNSGSSATRAYCVFNAAYVSRWMCEGRPTNVTVTGNLQANSPLPNGFLYFDPSGRPFNVSDPISASTFTNRLVMTFASGTSTYTVSVEPETGYVF